MTELSPPTLVASRGDLPVLLSVPHSGRDYPDWLVAMAAHGIEALRALDDPLVDRLIWRATKHGIGAVIARAPRAAVDCNRAEDEIDPAAVATRDQTRVSWRARGGLGIVPSRTPQHGFLWRGLLNEEQLEARLDQAHRPYHDAIERGLAALADRFGAAILIDCHSMPTLPRGSPQVVIGDLNGRSAAAWISREALRITHQAGFKVRLNRPYAGGHIVERHGLPARNVHALQIEIDRRCYLDSAMAAPGAGFDQAARLFECLAVGLGEALAARSLPAAAE